MGSFEPSGESDETVALLLRNLCVCLHSELACAVPEGAQAPGLSPPLVGLCHVLPLCTV